MTEPRSLMADVCSYQLVLLNLQWSDANGKPIEGATLHSILQKHAEVIINVHNTLKTCDS